MIGVIGGNGVAATNRLLFLVEEELTKRGAYRDCHHPEMLVWQATQAPSRSMYLEGKGPSWIEDYIEIGRKLKACGCTDLCMCCNTAHYAVDILEEQIGLPFINLLKEVALRVHELGCKKIGLMCTDGLRKELVYDKYFVRYAPNARIIYPSEEGQKLVTKGICNSKNTFRFLDSTDKDSPNFCFSAVCHEFEDYGVDCIVGGCTDISNVFSPLVNEKWMYVDSLKVLAQCIVEKYLPMRFVEKS
jgi:aspartate racemase